MTIESGNRPTGESIKKERLNELLGIDARILELIQERSRLMRKESSWRRSKGHSRIDPALEKGLWAEWELAGKELGVAPKLLRQLFSTLNILGDESAQIKRKADTGYVLRPRREPVRVTTPAPRSLKGTRMWTALSALANQDTLLTPVIQNDPLIELIKGLNQVGAGLSWTDESVEHLASEREPLNFEEKLVFVGDDIFNLHILVAQCLGGAGRVKFAGGAALKLADVTPLNNILPALGARIVPLNPHAKGLPVRIECGGEMQGKVAFPASAPADFAAALVLAAWSYPLGLHLTFENHPAAAEAAAEAAALLSVCGLDIKTNSNECIVPAAQPKLPGKPEPVVDAALAAYLLALPIFADGTVTLTNAPAQLASHPAMSALTALGIDLNCSDGDIIASAVKLPDQDIDFGDDPALLPLGLALALCAKRELKVSLPADPDAADAARQFLDRMGANYELEDSNISITPSHLGWEGTWASPDPYYCLGSALAAFVNPGIALENPGQLTSVWPQFWNIYNTLPTGKMRPAPVKETPRDKPKRRRIKI